MAYAAGTDRHKRIRCAGCGGDVVIGGKGGLPEGEAFCLSCRRAGLAPTKARHGTDRRYKLGCRCDECREMKAKRMSAYAARRLADGVNIYHQYRRSPTRSDWIRPSDRQAIYERDRWTCQLCGDPVDATLPPLHRFAATLDHIVPRSAAPEPDHSPENLRLAHRSCNSRRGTGEAA